MPPIFEGTKTVKMTTFNTISEAFQNGSGDCFFLKNGQYVARSRKDENLVKSMEAAGFTYLTHDEVLAAAHQQLLPVAAPVVKVAAPAPGKMVSSRDNISNGRDGYYDEFPDAYGQSL